MGKDKNEPKRKETPSLKRSDEWNIRIVGHEVRPASWFLANPKNWRIHPKNQQAGLTDGLNLLGWIDEVKVNKNTGFVVDGHLRVILALRKGEDTPVPLALLDLTEEEEEIALATYNPLASLAFAEKEKLQDLLQRIDGKVGDDLAFIMKELGEKEGIIGDLPDLESLKEEYGEPGETDFYPIIKVKVSPETNALYKELIDEIEGSEEGMKFGKILEFARIYIDQEEGS